MKRLGYALLEGRLAKGVVWQARSLLLANARRSILPRYPLKNIVAGQNKNLFLGTKNRFTIA